MINNLQQVKQRIAEIGQTKNFLICASQLYFNYTGTVNNFKRRNNFQNFNE